MTKENFAFDSLLLLDTKGLDFENKEIKFPFKVALSFRKLVDHIEERCKSNDKIVKSLAHSLLNDLKVTPELLEPIYDLSVIKKHERLISNLMLFVFPDAFLEKQTFAAGLPFMMDVFYSSPKFKEIIKIADGNIVGKMNLDVLAFNFGRVIGSYATVLNKVYGVNLQLDFPIVYKIPDPENGLDRYYKFNIADEFAEVIVKGKRKEFTEEEIASIRTHLYDLDYMKKMIPSDKYELQGFVVINVINITDTEILSSMKRHLIEKDTITSISGFLKLQHSIKSLLRCPDIFLGLADYPGSKEKLFRFGSKIGNSFLMNDKCVRNFSCECVDDSIYNGSLELKKIVIIEDLEKYPNRTIIEDEILKQGIKNILIAPLMFEDEIVGILELGSPIPGTINMINTLKLREVLPLFAMAVARSKEELNNKVQAVIKEKCTAIHPTLEWRFRSAALKLIKNDGGNNPAEMEEIVFHDVYPLYGLSDIRNSSLLRNNAIKDDLIDNLNLALDVIASAKKHKPLHAFDELIYKIDKKIDSLKFSIDSGDEAVTLGFLKKQIVPLFDHIYDYNQEVKEFVDKYNTSLDQKLGIVYKRRKAYEESATKLSDLIANYIDEEQLKIQDMFPHYFDRYKSDGVDHNIYIGSSLVETGKFNFLYLKNIRLWQLMVMCGIVRKTKEFKKHLSLPLETAHLILVQNSPLSIRFRFDEKKFDVDGAYNVRYEIMKKRIDKAEIKGREERLTQPEKIAIIYSQTSEAQEYSEYIEYLQANDYIKKEVEELELEEVQGVKGLKALRVSVNTESKNPGTYLNNENIQEAVKNMSIN